MPVPATGLLPLTLLCLGNSSVVGLTTDRELQRTCLRSTLLLRGCQPLQTHHSREREEENNSPCVCINKAEHGQV